MKKIQNTLLLLLCCSYSLISCHGGTGSSDVLDPDSVVTCSYAKGFEVLYYANYRKVVVHNSWQSDKALGIYYLVTEDSITTPADGIKIKIPIRSIATTSATHIAFLEALGELSSVKGVSTPELIYNATIRKAIAEHRIANIGDPFNLNIEQLMGLRSDVVMGNSYSNQDEQNDRLAQMGVPLIHNNEWMETSLLARAEWIKYVAQFYDKAAMADSLFGAIEARYNATKQLAMSTQVSPSVVSGGNFKGTWYMPGGRSYMGRLFSDVNCTYVYAQDTTTGSLPLNFETVLHKFSKADIWVNAQAHSLRELEQIDPRHGLFNAYKRGHVYAFYGRELSSGANDFWESGVITPEVVLSDMLWAIHPEIMPAAYRPYFIIKLQ